jgi:hypothetical protein
MLVYAQDQILNRLSPSSSRQSQNIVNDIELDFVSTKNRHKAVSASLTSILLKLFTKMPKWLFMGYKN